MSGGTLRGMLSTLLLTGLLATPASAWDKVTIVLQEPSGTSTSLEGSRIEYGYYTREFTPKGVRDRLRVERQLPFADRDIKFPDLVSIEFAHEPTGENGVLVPKTMQIVYQPRKNNSVEIERNVSDLRGFGNPKPVLFILTTEDGKVELDITPSYDEEQRSAYRPILRVLFE